MLILYENFSESVLTAEQLYQQPPNNIQSGAWNQVPLVIGSTRNEGFPQFQPATVPSEDESAYKKYLYDHFWQSDYTIEVRDFTFFIVHRLLVSVIGVDR